MNWISEKEASEMLDRKPRTLRKKVKSGAWRITYTNVEGRSFMYAERDILRFLDARSIKVKTA